MFNILIVEDDNRQRNNLAKMIREINCMYVVIEASNIKEANQHIMNHDIDLFYIDISLGNESGLDLAFEIRKNHKHRLTWIIFITTHVKYMLEAFKEVHCYNYILKPYDKEIVKELTLTLTQKSILKPEDTTKKKTVIFDIEEGISIKIYTNEIIFVEVFIRTCYVHTRAGKYTIKNLSLKKIVEIINDEDFMRCHRAYIVNTKYIKEIRKSINSWKIYFDGYNETALLGDKFKKDILNVFRYDDAYLHV